MQASSRARPRPSAHPTHSRSVTIALPTPMHDELVELAAERSRDPYGRALTYADMIRIACRQMIDRERAKREGEAAARDVVDAPKRRRAGAK